MGQKKQKLTNLNWGISVVSLDKKALAIVSNSVYGKEEVSKIAQGMFTPKTVLHWGLPAHPAKFSLS